MAGGQGDHERIEWHGRHSLPDCSGLIDLCRNFNGRDPDRDCVFNQGAFRARSAKPKRHSDRQRLVCKQRFQQRRSTEFAAKRAYGVRKGSRHFVFHRHCLSIPRTRQSGTWLDRSGHSLCRPQHCVSDDQGETPGGGRAVQRGRLRGYRYLCLHPAIQIFTSVPTATASCLWAHWRVLSVTF